MSLTVLPLPTTMVLIIMNYPKSMNVLKLSLIIAIFRKHNIVKPYSDWRFHSCIVLAENSPDALDWST